MMMNEPAHFDRPARNARAATRRSRSTRAGARAAPRDTALPARRSRRSRGVPAPVAAGEPVTVLGLGSNTLVRDGGVRGTVVVMHNPGAALAVADGLVYADAGVASPKLARFAATHGCAEAEFLAGIPGTVGGALAMNAGCYGGETWRYVARVEVLTRDGELRRAHAGRLRDRLSQRAPRATAPPLGRTSSPRRGSAFRRATSARARARIKELLARAHRDAAAVAAQRRQRVPQSAGRSRGAPDRGVRPQGPRDRRRARVGEARQLHRQSRAARAGGRHRGADRARARRPCARRPVSTSSPKCGSSGEGGDDAPIRQGRRAAGRAVGGARGVAHVRQRRARGAAREGRRRASRSIPPSATCGT